ncbi:hypothetical protein E4U41_007020 [Claviceps citrina]|nr:hypothetical protein E4U41_007020 [Claviceps citrina]
MPIETKTPLPRECLETAEQHHSYDADRGMSKDDGLQRHPTAKHGIGVQYKGSQASKRRVPRVWCNLMPRGAWLDRRDDKQSSSRNSRKKHVMHSGRIEACHAAQRGQDLFPCRWLKEKGSRGRLSTFKIAVSVPGYLTAEERG